MWCFFLFVKCSALIQLYMSVWNPKNLLSLCPFCISKFCHKDFFISAIVSYSHFMYWKYGYFYSSLILKLVFLVTLTLTKYSILKMCCRRHVKLHFSRTVRKEPISYFYVVEADGDSTCIYICKIWVAIDFWMYFQKYILFIMFNIFYNYLKSIFFLGAVKTKL